MRCWQSFFVRSFYVFYPYFGLDADVNWWRKEPQPVDNRPHGALR